MKKIFMPFLTFALLLGGIIVNISGNSVANLQFVKKASAETETRKIYSAPCPDGGARITVCGVGSSTCTPSGECD